MSLKLSKSFMQTSAEQRSGDWWLVTRAKPLDDHCVSPPVRGVACKNRRGNTLLVIRGGSTLEIRSTLSHALFDAVRKATSEEARLLDAAVADDDPGAAQLVVYRLFRDEWSI